MAIIYNYEHRTTSTDTLTTNLALETKLTMRILILIFLLSATTVLNTQAQTDSTAHPMREHHDHSSNQTGYETTSGLTETGNDIFGTIQEVISKLEADPNTDWSEVDIEALRQHLLDMKAMTEKTKVVERSPIEKGLMVRVKPTTERASRALDRVFDAHPPMLKKETGWSMQVTPKGELYQLRITTNNPGEVNKIRGLGYIGVMAYGVHHQKHHWMITTGSNPHK